METRTSNMHSDLPEALFDLPKWDQLSIQECERLACNVSTRLPASFRFARIATYDIGTQRRHVAHFNWQPSAEQAPVLFSLIPGATATLGFDRAHPFAVDKWLVLDWQRCCLECGDDFVDVSQGSQQEPDVPHYRRSMIISPIFSIR